MSRKPPARSKARPGAQPDSLHERRATLNIPPENGHGAAQVRVALFFLVGANGEPLLEQPDHRAVALSHFGDPDAATLRDATAWLRRELMEDRRREIDAWHAAQAKRKASHQAVNKRQGDSAERIERAQPVFDVALSAVLWVQAVIGLPRNYRALVERVWPAGEPKPTQRAWPRLKAGFTHFPIEQTSPFARALRACRTREGLVNWDKVRDAVRDQGQR